MGEPHVSAAGGPAAGSLLMCQTPPPGARSLAAVEEIEALPSAHGLLCAWRLRTLWLAGSVVCPLPPAQSHRTELISWFSFLVSWLGTFGISRAGKFTCQILLSIIFSFNDRPVVI